RMPIAICDLPVIAPANYRGGATVLLRTIDPVGKLIIDHNVIELRGGLVIPTGPTGAAVDADNYTLVHATDHAPGIVGIDPKRGIVLAAPRSLNCYEGLAGIN